MKEKTFENSILELEKIISDLESGSLDLDKSISKYTEAMKLIEFCENKLKKAEETVNKLVNADGTLEDFNKEEE